jgi:hypothetical protein
MSKRIKILSDYTSADDPNILTVFTDDQGDIHISLFQGNDDESGVRIAASGTRHTPRVREALRNLVKAYEEELKDPHCNPILKALNPNIK